MHTYVYRYKYMYIYTYMYIWLHPIPLHPPRGITPFGHRDIWVWDWDLRWDTDRCIPSHLWL